MDTVHSTSSFKYKSCCLVAYELPLAKTDRVSTRRLASMTRAEGLSTVVADARPGTAKRSTAASSIKHMVLRGPCTFSLTDLQACTACTRALHQGLGSAAGTSPQAQAASVLGGQCTTLYLFGEALLGPRPRGSRWEPS